MSIDIIKLSLEQADRFTQRFIDKIPQAAWDLAPGESGTTITWQLGHIVISRVFLNISCVVGRSEKLKEGMPLSEFGSLYGYGSNPMDGAKRHSPDQLLSAFELVKEVGYEALAGLTEADLQGPPMRNNPGGNTVQETLLWSAQHQSWHNGQMALLARMLKGDSA
ncbi:MAG: DinB family protein [Bacteroidota bacterium]